MLRFAVDGLPLFAALVAVSATTPKDPGSSPGGAAWARPAERPFAGPSLRPVKAAPHGPDGRVIGLAALGARPLSLAGDDFNHDGYPDFVAGYATNSGGLLVVYLASLEAFAPQSSQSIKGIARGEFPEPFSGGAAIPIPVAPEILAVGDFNRDGNADILFAAQGGGQFYVLPGDGAGNFGAAQSFPVPGGITALAAAPSRATASGATLAIGVDSGSDSELLVYESSPGGWPIRSASYSFGGRISSVAMGDLDGDRYRDLAIVAGGALFVIHGGGAAETPTGAGWSCCHRRRPRRRSRSATTLTMAVAPRKSRSWRLTAGCTFCRRDGRTNVCLANPRHDDAPPERS